MVRFLNEQDQRDDYRGRRPFPTRSHHSGRDRDYSPDFISGPGSRVPRPYATGAIPSTATATVHDHQVPPPPVPSPPLSPPISTARNGPPQYVYDDNRGRSNTSLPLRGGRERSWERGSGTSSYAPPPPRDRNISVSRSPSRSRGPPSSAGSGPGPGTRERRIVRETKIYGGPELRDPETREQILAVSDQRNRGRARSPSEDSRATSRSRSRARSVYTTDDDSDYPRSRSRSRGAASHSRRRSPSPSRSTRSRSTRSRSRRSPSPAPIKKAKELFSPSTAALGVGVLGAIVGGLAAREATEHISHRHKSHKSNGSYDGHGRSRKEESRERKAALISTIVGAAVGGLGANVLERKLEEKKRMEKEERKRMERGGYRELRDRDLEWKEDGGRSRSRNRHGTGSLDMTGYSDDDEYYGSERGRETGSVRGR